MLALLDNRWVARAGNLSFLAGLVVLLVRVVRGLPLTALVALLLAVGVVLMALPHLARLLGQSATAVPSPAVSPKVPTAPVAAPALFKAQGTNDGQFPLIESAVDSLGHKAERVRADGLDAMTGHVLRPGQKVTFEIKASDPNGDDLELSVIASPAKDRADVAIGDGIVTWNVSEADIGDPAFVHIYVQSQRNYHRHDRWDDAVTFTYRVLPRA